MYTIKIAPGALSGKIAEVFFAYLQQTLSVSPHCATLYPDKKYTYTQKKTGTDDTDDPTEYSFEIAQTILCRRVKESQDIQKLSYLLSYINTTNMVGKGAFGRVYRIDETYRCDKTLFTPITYASPLVVKIQHHCDCTIEQESMCAHSNPKKMAAKEYYIGKKIPHLGVQEIFFANPTSFLIMYQLPGRNLDAIINDDRKQIKRLTIEQRLKTTRSLLRALYEQVTRLNLIHEDIKPANLIISEEWNAHVIDYGSAKSIPIGESYIKIRAIHGSPNFLAPEKSWTSGEKNSARRAEDSEFPLTLKADVFSLGRVLMALWTGTEAGFHFTTVDELLHYVQHDLTNLTDLFSDITDIELDNTLKQQLTWLIRNMLTLNPQERSRIEEAKSEFAFIHEAWMKRQTPNPISSLTVTELPQAIPDEQRPRTSTTSQRHVKQMTFFPPIKPPPTKRSTSPDDDDEESNDPVNPSPQAHHSPTA